jgi:ribosomal protein L34E
LNTQRTFRRQRQDRPLDLPTCSICLRVLHGWHWIDPDELIRSKRTFESPAVPRLGPALCDSCCESIRVRRERQRERLDGALVAYDVS